MRKSKKLVTPDGLRLYAVIDTNVIVSSFFSLDGSSNPAEVIKAVFEGIVTPLYSDEILEEYKDALLVTGNKKHFPEKPFVITPTELVAIIKKG